MVTEKTSMDNGVANENIIFCSLRGLNHTRLGKACLGIVINHNRLGNACLGIVTGDTRINSTAQWLFPNTDTE